MEHDGVDKDVREFIKWAKTCVATAIVTALLGIGACALTILKELTDLEERAPFLYGKVWMGVLLALFVLLVTVEIFCLIKARKYKKSIEKSEGDKPGSDGQNGNENGDI